MTARSQGERAAAQPPANWWLAKVSRDEWVAKYGSLQGFDEYDLNGDGIIDPDEFRTGIQLCRSHSHLTVCVTVKAGEIRFSTLDTNRDGKISKEEWVAKYGSDAGFDEYDLNGDGIIDPDEYRAVNAAKATWKQAANEMDTNRDGKISREEWIARYGTDDGFNEYDLNGDGIIDAEEWLLVKKQKAVAATCVKICPIPYCANAAQPLNRPPRGRSGMHRGLCFNCTMVGHPFGDSWEPNPQYYTVQP